MNGTGTSDRAATAVVVNDDATQLKVLAGLLAKDGLDVSSFESATDALRAMDPLAPPDLIVSDLYMPGIDGWRFCRLLRSPEYEALNEVPILVVSATFSGEEVARITADVGANAFMPSPVDGWRFLDTVHTLLRGESRRHAVRVLVVEGDWALAGILKRAFAAHGYQAEAALTASEAGRMFAAASYDVAILNQHLPDGMGDTLLERFRTERPACICIMTTADVAPELALEWMKRGAAEYARAPFEPEYLIELCARARRQQSLLRVEDQLELRTRELKESEEKFRSMAEQLTDMIFLADRRGVINYVSSASEHLLGYAPGEVVGRHFGRFLARSDVRRAAATILETETCGIPAKGCVLQVRRKDGSFFTGELSGTPAMFGTRPGAVLGILRDITDRLSLEEQLRQSQKMEAIGRLAGGVAHDFNNLLSVILSYTDFALEGVRDGDPLRDDLCEIQQAGARAATLTRQLLAFSRRQMMQPQIIDLNGVAQGLESMLRRIIGEDIELAIELAPDLGAVKADPGQIEQVIMNLAVNARDAMAQGGRFTIETANVDLDAEYASRRLAVTPGPYVMLAMTDTGCGMDEATKARLFEPFFTTKEMGKGTGLGLSTVYGIVQQSGGNIWVHSEPGRGTTFKVYLPREPGAARGVAPVTHPPPRPEGTETVLVVEDEEAVRNLARRVLQSAGYTVLTAANGGEALLTCEQHGKRINLMLTDLVMPQMNGRQLAMRLSSLHPKMRVLYMSGYADQAVVEGGELDRDIAFIGKPFNAAQLTRKVREVLDA
ncbi:MAG: response regulator [Deltaproteobacteria bacterium]|nr:response regulator [Deltaproteobacteria bacterium]